MSKTTVSRHEFELSTNIICRRGTYSRELLFKHVIIYFNMGYDVAFNFKVSQLGDAVTYEYVNKKKVKDVEKYFLRRFGSYSDMQAYLALDVPSDVWLRVRACEELSKC